MAQGCQSGIFRVHDDGSGLRRLTNGSPPDAPSDGYIGGDGIPSWSPTGAQIVFQRQTRDGSGLDRLFVMGAEGSGQRRLLPQPPPGYDEERYPAWSPRGDRIAFTSYLTDQTRRSTADYSEPTFVVRPDGGDIQRVSPPGWQTLSPTFTADGSRVVYSANLLDFHGVLQESGLYETELSTGRTERLAFGGVPVAGSGPQFSPDGRFVALTLLDGRLYTMRVDGTNLTERTEPFAVGPTWSPLGPTLFYSRSTASDPTHWGLFKLDLAGDGRSVPITRAVSQDGSPDWTGAAADPTAPHDTTPPLAVLGQQFGAVAGAHTARKMPAAPARSRIPFLVADVSGIRRVDVSVALKTSRGCRFLGSSGLGRPAGCRHPRFHRVRTAAGWARRTGKLRRGRYVVSFRTTDVRGHVTRHPKRRSVVLP